MFKKIFTILAAVLIICSTAYCFDLLDTGAAVSLEIKYQYDNNDIGGAKFDLYKVAEVSKFVNYTPTEQFRRRQKSCSDSCGICCCGQPFSTEIRGYRRERRSYVP